MNPEPTLPDHSDRAHAVFGSSGRVTHMLKPSVILAESGPLRWKSQINGVPKLQGVFTMRDQEGFPLDMAYEIAKERGWVVDWVEALADAARQCIFKYDALIEEIGMLEPDKLEGVKRIFACGLMSSEGATFCDKAKDLYRRMRESHLPNRELSQPPSVDNTNPQHES
jgi:hypothetical protein